MDGAETSGKTRFGAELRAQRTARKWTQVQLGQEIGYSGSFISDVERGDRGVSDDFAMRCDGVFECPGTFMRLWHDLQHEAFPMWFAPIVPLEREATKIDGWEPNTVPGLLQTEEYTRELARTRRPQDDEAAIERTVQARVDRQAILARSKPPMVFYVISEAVLRQCIGGPEVMVPQVDKLIKAAEAPGVMLQVLPFSAHQSAGSSGLLYLYERSSEPLAAYAECLGGGRLIMDSTEVSEMATVITMVRAAALPPWESVTLMRSVRRDLEQR